MPTVGCGLGTEGAEPWEAFGWACTYLGWHLRRLCLAY